MITREIIPMIMKSLLQQNIKLQIAARQRVITSTQVTNFIWLTANIPKFPVRVGIGEVRDETANYAWQIRQMLNQAHFVTPDSDTNLVYGISTRVGSVTTSMVIGDTNEWSDIEFLSDVTNDFMVFHYSDIEKTNGFVRYTIPTGNTNDIFAAFTDALNQIGIKITINYQPDWVTPNHCEIYIRQKPQ
jgi:hypothetical protein